MKIYLINPQIPVSFAGNEYAAQMLFKKYSTPPLGLLTIAAMIPPSHKIAFCDENASRIEWNNNCDIVVLSGMHIQKKRLREIAVCFRELGKKIIVGGPSAMAVPEWYRDIADILVLGEAERIWPECLSDLEAGRAKDVYEEKETIQLHESPIPRFDLITPRHYMNMSLQTTRGCPYSCEFCDIITLYGRKMRTKPIEHVLAEFKTLFRLGGERIFLVDDNFIGDPGYTSELLRAMIRMNQQLKRSPKFSCQITINVAQNIPLLKLLHAAGCRSMFIGIETPRIESLKETHKFHNARTDMAEDIKTIQSHGISVYSGMVVGFDHDDSTIFEEQLRFTNRAHVPISGPTQLTALPGTPLYTRIKAEGRLKDEKSRNWNWIESNIIPKQMTSEELNEGYVSLIEKLYAPEAFTNRIFGELERLEHTEGKLSASNLNILLVLLGFFWVLLWYLFDPHRKKLLHAFWRLFPAVLVRHPKTTAQALLRLVLYRHICRFVGFRREELGCEEKTLGEFVPSFPKRFARTA